MVLTDVIFDPDKYCCHICSADHIVIYTILNLCWRDVHAGHCQLGVCHINFATSTHLLAVEHADHMQIRKTDVLCANAMMELRETKDMPSCWP